MDEYVQKNLTFLFCDLFNAYAHFVSSTISIHMYTLMMELAKLRGTPLFMTNRWTHSNPFQVRPFVKVFEYSEQLLFNFL